jgi:hypothetical protein
MEMGVVVGPLYSIEVFYAGHFLAYSLDFIAEDRH